MNEPRNPDAGKKPNERELSTADLAAAARQPATVRNDEEQPGRQENRDNRVLKATEHKTPSERAQGEKRVEGEKLEPLFTPEMATKYRSRWMAVQTNFVDNPKQAVRQGDELVALVITNLAESFSAERKKLEGELGGSGEAATETLRLALRRYRSFFDRLLSL